MKRRYYVSFINKKDGLRCSGRIIDCNTFDMKEVAELIEKQENCKDIVILFFKELEKWEK